MYGLDEEKDMKWLELILLLIAIYFVFIVHDFKLWLKGVKRPEGDPE